MITGERELYCDRGGLIVRHLSRDLDRSPSMIIRVGDIDRESRQPPGSMTIRVGDWHRDLLRGIGPGTRVRGRGGVGGGVRVEIG
jgi:hypothetical protein